MKKEASSQAGAHPLHPLSRSAPARLVVSNQMLGSNPLDGLAPYPG